VTDTAAQTRVRTLRATLEAAGQAHLLAFSDELDRAGRQRLLCAIESLNPDRLADLSRFALDDAPDHGLSPDLAPAPYYPRDPASPQRPWDRDRDRATGEALIRAGKVAVFTVAGGQGTRLGFSGPKGCYPAGAVTGKTLFQILAEQVRAASSKFGVTLPWRIMTSPLNHDATIAYFDANDSFGLEPGQLGFFRQGVLPTFDAATGAVLLAAKDAPATNPDGHGGSLRALYHSGAIDDLARLGVEHLSYTQIDNPLIRAVDPVFLGLHAHAPDSSAEMSSKMIAKTDPAEKVGVFCTAGGRLRIIEYSDLPRSLAEERDEAGALRYGAGSPAIHIISLDFIRRLNEAPGGFALPLHRARKTVPFIDPTSGERVEPPEPNAIKLETFVFDALPLCERSIILETDRFEFAPIKNATGADSPDMSARLQTERNARWLEAAGVRVPRTASGDADCAIEISPLTALDAEDLQRAELPASIEPGARIAV